MKHAKRFLIREYRDYFAMLESAASVIRPLVDAENGGGYFDWSRRLDALVRRFLGAPDYETVRALVEHLLPDRRRSFWSVRLDRETQIALSYLKRAEGKSNADVLRDTLEAVLFEWDQTAHKEPYRIGTVHERRNGWHGLLIQIEHAVKRSLVSRSRLLAGARPLADEVSRDDLAHDNNPFFIATDNRSGIVALSNTLEPVADSVEPTQYADVRQDADSMRDELRARLAVLPVKGLQRRIVVLMLGDSTLTEADFARRLGTSAGSVRTALTAIVAKLKTQK